MHFCFFVIVINEKVIESLKLLFNRGFTKGHIFGADSNELYNSFPVKIIPSKNNK